MNENEGVFLIYNGELVKSEGFEKIARVNGEVSGKVYEVIRVINGIPLFIEEHYERMKESMRLLGVKLEISLFELVDQVKRLAEANGLDSFNIKVTAAAFQDRQEVVMYVIRHYYPPREEIDRGVSVSLFKRERNNPNIKIINTDYKEAVSRKIQEHKVFEVLLVNDRDEITEGSRSNVFFVKAGKVYTAPGDQVLKGITRKYIIDTCINLGYEVLEEHMPISILLDVEGIFISGTSIKVLPVACIRTDKGVTNYASSTNRDIVKIRDGFDKLLEEYINSRK